MEDLKLACTVEEVVEQVQFVLGMPDESVLPTSVVTIIVNNYTPYYDLTDYCCELIYYSAIACIEFMIRKLGQSVDGLGGGSRTEKDGTTSISVSSGSGNGIVDFWKNELKRFRNDPSTLLPCMREVKHNITASSGYIIMGGVSKLEVDRVNSDPDSYSAEDGAFDSILFDRDLRG